jgi:hypothetical protein
MNETGAAGQSTGNLVMIEDFRLNIEDLRFACGGSI